MLSLSTWKLSDWLMSNSAEDGKVMEVSGTSVIVATMASTHSGKMFGNIGFKTFFELVDNTLPIRVGTRDLTLRQQRYKKDMP